MRQEIETDLPSQGQPVSWAVSGNGMIHTTQRPVREDGRILEDDITEQTARSLANLRRTLEQAGAGLEDVLQVQIFLTDRADVKAVDAVYARHFSAPYPSRSIVIVAGLTEPGMRIELTAVAALPARGR
ncbi:RidA family protein [Roseomonas marmotae]|uniref:RidA family protein n=1 Tax=Roseomonas marmotae TaxID=2768161 RepID=A0ABS3K7M5_9PROT|nr:RidA family protein [Roseomonas marmotae]MBO1073462.1 RidA family protein [Roseomonas marmotae]QTI80343.1 RidA family protein [Roseomonas marmotae]